MHITGMKLGGVWPFTDPIVLRFDERVNVFIGPNASGKSRALQVMADCLGVKEENAKKPISDGRAHLSATLVSDDEFDDIVAPDAEDWAANRNYLFGSEDWQGTRDKLPPAVDQPAVIYLGSAREGLPGISNGIEPAAYGETAENALAGPFSGSRVNCAYMLLGTELRELGDELKRRAEDSPYQKMVALRDAEEFAGSCIQQICDEVIRDAKLERFIPDRYALNNLRDPHGDLNDIIVRGSLVE